MGLQPSVFTNIAQLSILGVTLMEIHIINHVLGIRSANFRGNPLNPLTMRYTILSYLHSLELLFLVLHAEWEEDEELGSRDENECMNELREAYERLIERIAGGIPGYRKPKVVIVFES